ncbi:beta-ketoacyl synthase N-terminal-like domain-containing protein [Chryseobacterium wangxinyae]|uniref:beta-ketoacyl synthase N-terminal-like domain-containing protein n=1 Tax=Chryseobacterium sp. CY350 TaxID=2997336 RepID=UPI00226F87C2|nr:beta-ketoacyl synthase N-terminal-like domain-containing protein [Chryseobacterium sp. CY350]MCY0976815.1 beta-ketoacyl synthase N-terminal-like domain-containing protein [Chryseobacterium sp. CY350]WBZ96816.1 beta-ketoacyl synthase N-terminal-like domain-containing protein [Chryseobacterium sp. CY350]
MTANNTSNKDIVISAIGFNSPYGTEIDNYFCQNESENKNLIIEDHDPQKFLKPKGQRFLNKATLVYGNVAFHAINNRDLKSKIDETPERIGLYDGTELSNLEDCFIFDLTAKNQGPDRVSPMKAPSTIANAAASQMAIQAGIKGPNFSVCAGMAGSLQALDIATLHLKQGITDYGVIASTEIRNYYQESIRRGNESHHRNISPELGIAMVLERRETLILEGKKPLATIKKIHSETHTEDLPIEAFLFQNISNMADQYSFDTVIFSGGTSTINEKVFEEVLKKNGLNMSVIYPETLFGDNDNAGGMLGIAYGIAIFEGKNVYKTDKENILVLSSDKTGTVILTVIEKA